MQPRIRNERILDRRKRAPSVCCLCATLKICGQDLWSDGTGTLLEVVRETRENEDEANQGMRDGRCAKEEISARFHSTPTVDKARLSTLPSFSPQQSL
jgi:hypothetical protein